MDNFPDKRINDTLGRGKSFIELKYTGKYPHKEKQFNISWNRFLAVDNNGKYITLRPAVALHGVTGRRYSDFSLKGLQKKGFLHTKDTYADLLGILQEGFRHPL